MLKQRACWRAGEGETDEGSVRGVHYLVKSCHMEKPWEEGGPSRLWHAGTGSSAQAQLACGLLLRPDSMAPEAYIVDFSYSAAFGSGEHPTAYCII